MVKGRPGIAGRGPGGHRGSVLLEVWQFTIVGIAGEDDDLVEPLLVVTTGRPALRVVAAGTDVCTDRVSDDAPPGIRVRACGS